jgi:hypothetical protein
VGRPEEEKTLQSELNRTVLLPGKIYDHRDGENYVWNLQVLLELLYKVFVYNVRCAQFVFKTEIVQTRQAVNVQRNTEERSRNH